MFLPFIGVNVFTVGYFTGVMPVLAFGVLLLLWYPVPLIKSILDNYRVLAVYLGF